MCLCCVLLMCLSCVLPLFGFVLIVHLCLCLGGNVFVFGRDVFVSFVFDSVVMCVRNFYVVCCVVCLFCLFGCVVLYTCVYNVCCD